MRSGVGGAVEGRPLARRPADRADRLLHPLRRHLLAVGGAGRAEMDSFISVPPRSFAPPRSAACAPSTPSFTQEAWTFVIHGWSASRPTACMSTASRKVGPGRARPFR